MSTSKSWRSKQAHHAGGGFRILVWEGHWKSTSGVQGPSPGGAGSKPKECCVMMLKTTNTEKKNKSIQTDTV